MRQTAPADWISDDTVWHVNPTGKFVVGGPDGDTGLTRATIEPASGNVQQDIGEVIVFPPYQIETRPGDRQRFLLGTFDGFYEFGPFFFRPGDSMRVRLDLVRSLPAGNRTVDNTERRLHFDVRFIDTYEG